MKRFLIIIFFSFPLLTFSQIPDGIKAKADSILISICSKELFTQIFRYNCFSGSTIVSNTYWHDCEDYTKKQKKLFSKQCLKEKNMQFDIVYDCLLLDTIENFVRISLDKNGNLLKISGIPSKENFHILTNLTIKRKKALELAINSGFADGLIPWKFILSFEKQKNDITEKYYWGITNTIYIGSKDGCQSRGEILYIDAISGNIVSKTNWVYSCVY